MMRRTPVWMTILILIVLLPAFSLPALLDKMPNDNDVLVSMAWIYPFYMMLSAWLAWNSYPTRPAVCWILIVVMLMSTCAIWYIALNPQLVVA